MISLSLENVCLSFGAEDVLKDVSFSTNEGDKVGIIGSNGAGKSSLFRVITGKYNATGGAVYIGKGLSVGMLEQNPNLSALPEDLCCLEYMYTAFPRLLDIEAELSSLEAAVSLAADGGDEARAVSLAAKLGDLNKVYAELGGLEFRSRCRGMLLHLGFDEELIGRKIKTLSGGQYTRLALARLLATEPDILMLDEPTNHLDIDALAWLESFISSYKKTVLIISHDRYFLDRTTTKTLHITYGKARLWPGSFTASREMREAEAESLEKKYKEQQKEIAKIRANIEFQRRCNREHNFVTIRSKEKQIERMKLVELAPPEEKKIRMSFAAEEESAGDVLSVKNLAFSYSGRRIISNLSFLVRKGERVMVLGPNGSGKSTLMKLINSVISPSEGKITLGYNIKIGYYDQENRGLSESNTVFSEMRNEYPLKTDFELRSALALFLFGAEDMDKPVSTLSGGERARLTLAKLILKKVNLLIMDEPTNHLDTGSMEALESALIAFPGTIIAVSHDRYFINRIATRIIELDTARENGMLDYPLEDYDDAFEKYMQLREIARLDMKTQETDKKSTASKTDYEEMKKRNASRRKEERKIERAKVKIEELEAELEELDCELFGEAATNYLRAAEIDRRKAAIEEELLELYDLVM